jgi:hypothetical protein
MGKSHHRIICEKGVSCVVYFLNQSLMISLYTMMWHPNAGKYSI